MSIWKEVMSSTLTLRVREKVRRTREPREPREAVEGRCEEEERRRSCFLAASWQPHAFRKALRTWGGEGRGGRGEGGGEEGSQKIDEHDSELEIGHSLC